MTSRSHRIAAARVQAEDGRADLYGRQLAIAARLVAEAAADQPVPYTLTPQAEEELALAAEAEAEDRAPEGDDADSAAYHARVEAGLEPEAEI
jgi:hypothetical protein